MSETAEKTGRRIRLTFGCGTCGEAAGEIVVWAERPERVAAWCECGRRMTPRV